MPADDEKKSVGIFLRGITDDDRRRFKALCAEKGVFMSDVLIAYIKACVQENSVIVKA